MTKPQASDSPILQATGTKREGERYRPGSRAGVGGRKSSYTEAMGLEICARLSSGESLNVMLKDKALPSRSTVMRWSVEIPEFREMYARARERLLDVYADEIITIADDGTTDYVIKTGRNGHEYEAVDQEHIQRSRLRVESRKWLLSKLRPETYGDRITADVTGSVDHKHDISTLSEREKMRRFALFMIEDQRQPVIDGQLANGTKSHVTDETNAPSSAHDGPVDDDDRDASA